MGRIHQTVSALGQQPNDPPRHPSGVVAFADAIAPRRLARRHVDAHVEPLAERAYESVVEFPARVREEPTHSPVNAYPNRQQDPHNRGRFLVRHVDAARKAGAQVNHVEELTAAGNFCQVDRDGVVEHSGARQGHDGPRGAGARRSTDCTDLRHTPQRRRDGSIGTARFLEQVKEAGGAGVYIRAIEPGKHSWKAHAGRQHGTRVAEREPRGSRGRPAGRRCHVGCSPPGRQRGSRGAGNRGCRGTRGRRPGSRVRHSTHRGRRADSRGRRVSRHVGHRDLGRRRRREGNVAGSRPRGGDEGGRDRKRQQVDEEVARGIHPQRHRDPAVLEPERVAHRVEHRHGRAESRPAHQEREIARDHVNPQPLKPPSEADGDHPMSVSQRPPGVAKAKHTRGGPLHRRGPQGRGESSEVVAQPGGSRNRGRSARVHNGVADWACRRRQHSGARRCVAHEHAVTGCWGARRGGGRRGGGHHCRLRPGSSSRSERSRRRGIRWGKGGRRGGRHRPGGGGPVRAVEPHVPDFVAMPTYGGTARAGAVQTGGQERRVIRRSQGNRRQVGRRRRHVAVQAVQGGGKFRHGRGGRIPRRRSGGHLNDHLLIVREPGFAEEEPGQVRGRKWGTRGGAAHRRRNLTRYAATVPTPRVHAYSSSVARESLTAGGASKLIARWTRSARAPPDENKTDSSSWWAHSAARWVRASASEPPCSNGARLHVCSQMRARRR